LELVLQRAVPVSQELYQVCEQQVVIEQGFALQNLRALSLTALPLVRLVPKYLEELQA
jgi:hypothetical protein